MTFNIIQAAKEAGVDKSTISKAIKSGRLSALRKEQGGYEIDPAELFRVFPRVSKEPAEPELSDATTDLQGENRVLRIKLEAAELRLHDAELRIRDKDDEIRDLRHRLDTEGEERRKLTMMLLAYHQHVQLNEDEKKQEDIVLEKPVMQPGATTNTPPKTSGVWTWLRRKG